LALRLSDFWSWHGRVGRGKYLALGIILFAIKHNLDRLIAALYGHPWSVFNYWVFPDAVTDLNPGYAKFYATLVAAALPFIWIGVVLTLRRLRDAQLPLPLVLLFFLPFVNLFFFLVLSIIPSASDESSEKPADRFRSPISRAIPQSEFGSAALGVVATVIFSVVAVIFGTEALGDYGWGVFVGIPFFLGLSSVLIYGIHQPRSLGRCMLVSLLSVCFTGLLIGALAVEGVICLAMAFPLAVPIAMFGGFIGYVLQQRNPVSSGQFRVVGLVFLVVPGFMLIENSMEPPSPLYEVKTSVVISARPEQVWNQLIAFGELRPPTEVLFKTGIAYPIRAEIEGNGVGAIRRCMFSTGEFVEPITVWDEPRLLQFDVSSQPRMMDELSIYRDLHPPHLENYLNSLKGQFMLKPQPDGTTLLEGTTWYQNRFWPAAYWHLWSDYIIHRIHERVLLHIKELSEKSK
jgi:uncharacterized membrane protein YhaH (DUF805 family)